MAKPKESRVQSVRRLDLRGLLSRKEQLERQLSSNEPPLLVASTKEALGSVCLELGEFRRAEAHLSDALAIIEKEHDGQPWSRWRR